MSIASRWALSAYQCKETNNPRKTTKNGHQDKEHLLKSCRVMSSKTVLIWSTSWRWDQRVFNIHPQVYYPATSLPGPLVKNWFTDKIVCTDETLGSNFIKQNKFWEMSNFSVWCAPRPNEQHPGRCKSSLSANGAAFVGRPKGVGNSALVPRNATQQNRTFCSMAH